MDLAFNASLQNIGIIKIKLASDAQKLLYMINKSRNVFAQSMNLTFSKADVFHATHHITGIQILANAFRALHHFSIIHKQADAYALLKDHISLITNV